MQRRFEYILANRHRVSKAVAEEVETTLSELKDKKIRYRKELGDEQIEKIVRLYIARAKAMNTSGGDVALELNYPNGRKLKICTVYHEHLKYVKPDALEEKALICKDLFFSDGVY
jgi:hypothetical protein